MIELGKIELEEPYKSKWKYGYIVINKEPRRNVILYNSDSDRSTVSYAKYLYEITNKCVVPDGYVIDHIDNNQMNDIIENYQMITITENNIKANKHNKNTRQMVKFRCGSCGKEFDKPRNLTHLVIKRNKDTYCSRSCASLRLGRSVVLSEYRH